MLPWQQNLQASGEQALAICVSDNSVYPPSGGELVITVALVTELKNGKGETNFNLSLFLKGSAAATGMQPCRPRKKLTAAKLLDSKLTNLDGYGGGN